MENPAFAETKISPDLGASNKKSQKISGAHLTWSNLKIQVTIPDPDSTKKLFKPKTQKSIITNINGSASPGQLIAIMGASGAGKTTLLNVLSNQNMKGLQKSGAVYLNGKEVNNIQDYSAYVQQEDMFYGTLTCREHLKFQANLRGVENPDHRVEEVIQEMGLQKCADSKIGTPGRGKTISGGEKKRLSVATQILAQPSLLFLDEPTSGLDSFLAMQVVKSLQKISDSGTTVLCTIHQPSSEVFAMFNNLYLLARGRICYSGTTANALEYFENTLNLPCPREYNPADHYIAKTAIEPLNVEASEQKISEICDILENTESYQKLINDIKIVQPGNMPARFNPVGFGTQVYWNFWRSVIINYRDPMVIGIKIFITLFIALIFGLIYLNPNPEGIYVAEMFSACYENGTVGPIIRAPDIMNINGGLFVSLTNQSFSNVFAVIGVFPFIIPIWRIEHYMGLYKMPLAFIATNLAEIPVLLLLPLAWTGVTYFMFGFAPTVGQFFMQYFIIELVTQCAISFGYMLSSFSENPQVINAISAPLLIPLLLFGGFYLNADSIPDYFIWLKYLSWFYYGNEALVINQWSGEELSCGICVGDESVIVPYAECADVNMQVTGDSVIAALGFDKSNLWFDIGLMFALVIFYRSIAFLVLSIKFRSGNR